MKLARLTISVAALSFIVGFWAACTIGFDPTESESRFSCTEDSDCINPYQCLGGICKQTAGTVCEDADEDGFGVGEEELRRDCPACVNQGQCGEDCNDNDPSVAPGLLETCDGVDNNCDGEVDEPIPCETPTDCPDETPYLPSCNFDSGECEYKPPLQTAAPECGDPVACVDGEREDRPDECF